VTVSALVVRRFNTKADGTAALVERARTLELPCAPGHGNLIDPADGTGEMVVSFVRLQAARSSELGVQPPRVMVQTKTEPGSGLEAAVKAGWARLDAPRPPETPEK
jgi:hypothetical protein